MEYFKEECINMEQSMKNLLAAICIKENPNIDYIDKQIQLMSIHHEPDEFVEDYLNVAPYVIDNINNKEMLKKIQFIIPFVNYIFSKPEATIGRKKYFEKFYEENLVDAINLIKEFIMDKKYDNETDFIYYKMISSVDFNAALKIVSEKDKLLYKLYRKKIKYLEDSKYERACNNLKEIALGIKTGYLSDGTEFDELQFWKLVPFKSSKGIDKDFEKFKKINPKIRNVSDNDFYLVIKEFVIATMPDLEPTILEYMKEKKLLGYTYLSFKEYRKIHDDKAVLLSDGLSSVDSIYEKYCPKSLYDLYFIDDDIQCNILKEILEKELPHIAEVYHILKEKYGKTEKHISQVLVNSEL